LEHVLLAETGTPADEPFAFLSVATAGDGASFVVANPGAGVIDLWAVEPSPGRKPTAGEGPSVQTVDCRIARARPRGRVRLVMPDGAVRRERSSAVKSCPKLAAPPDGTWVAAAFGDGSLARLDAADGRDLARTSAGRSSLAVRAGASTVEVRDGDLLSRYELGLVTVDHVRLSDVAYVSDWVGRLAWLGAPEVPLVGATRAVLGPAVDESGRR
jgi:hypothetical protein